MVVVHCPVLSNFLRPYELQYSRPLCSSPSPKVCPSSCPLHWWCHLAISDTFFSFCPQSFPTSGTLPVSHLFASDDQKYWRLSISTSSDYSSLTSLKIDRFDLLAVQGNFGHFLQHHSSKASILWYSALFTVNTAQISICSLGLSSELHLNLPTCSWSSFWFWCYLSFP